MSEFDREAEKERLREKFEKDRADREATRRMSELLLKGATMTNMHCDRCGDPIFRHQGREFCPTCEAEGVEGAGQVPAAEATTKEEPTAETAETAAEPEGVAEPEAPAEPAAPPSAVPTAGPTGGPVTAGPGAADGDLAEARAAMVRTVTALARRAEAADDVGRTRTLLAAVREAAEALAAIEAADR